MNPFEELQKKYKPEKDILLVYNPTGYKNYFYLQWWKDGNK